MKVEYKTTENNSVRFKKEWFNFFEYATKLPHPSIKDTLKNDYNAEVTSYAAFDQIVTFASEEDYLSFIVRWS